MSSQLIRGLRQIRLAQSVLLSSSRQCQGQQRPPHLLLQQVAMISTSKKNRDVTITADSDIKSATKQDDAATWTSSKKKQWISYGFGWETEEDDLNTRNLVMFFTVTVCMVGVGFIVAYYPDVKLRSWVQREGYIELARREALGLPHVDGELVPVEDINLPTEEELGDFDVIV